MKVLSLALLLTVLAPAQIDPTIPLRYRPPQIADPLETMRRVQEIRNMQIEAQRQALEADPLRMENEARAKQLAQSDDRNQAHEAERQRIERRLEVARQGAPATSPPSEAKSAGLYNGRWWKFLEGPYKILWLDTYANGVIYATGVTGDADKVKLLLPFGLTFAEASKALDAFYDVPENGAIPIASALQIVTMKSFGIDQAVIDQQINGFRRAGLGGE